MIDKLKNLRKINLIKLFRLDKLERQMIFSLGIIVLVIINLIVIPFSIRLDLSLGKAYTLSSSTKKILKNLDDLVTIQFFVSSDLPTRMIPLKNDVIDLLNEYKRDSSKIIVKILDPKKDESTLSQAQDLGIPELQFSQMDKDKYAVTAAYFGIGITYGDKKEIIPQLNDLESLEYNLTASIYKMTNKSLAKIGIIGKTDPGNSQTDTIANLNKMLAKQFETGYVDISTGSATKNIDSSYKTILVFDNTTKPLDENEIKAINDYLKNKGKAVFFVNGVMVDESLQAAPNNSGLISIAGNYGVQINNDLILSTSGELVNFGNQYSSFFLPYPFWIKTNVLNTKSEFNSSVTQLTYPWVSSLKLENKNSYTVSPIVKTTDKSWEQTNNFVLDPQTIPEPTIKDLKQYIITADSKNSNGSELVVIPSSRFIEDRFLSQTSNNLGFVMNILNGLASDGALSGISQRAVAFYPIPDIPDSQKDMFKYINILLLPSLFALYGTWRLIKRK